jgi:anti-sigma B factor antagonist
MIVIHDDIRHEIRKERVMKYQTRDEADVKIISCQGRMDANSSPQFKEYLKHLIEQGQTQLIISMDEVEFLDSSGLGALVACLRKAKDKKGDIKISGLLPEVRSIFDMTRVSRLFDIYPDTPSALKAFKGLT